VLSSTRARASKPISYNSPVLVWSSELVVSTGAGCARVTRQHEPRNRVAVCAEARASSNVTEMVCRPLKSVPGADFGGGKPPAATQHSGSQQLRKALVRNGAAISTHPDFVARHRSEVNRAQDSVGGVRKRSWTLSMPRA